MTYTELLDRFWAMDRDFSFAERTLYLFLLHYCNSLDWPDTFSLSNDEISERLNCSPNSIRAARKTLIDSRLIFLHTGNGKGVSTLYSIAAEGNPEASAKGSKFEPFSDPPKEKQNEKENFPPAPPIKKKINKKKITQSHKDFATTQVNARVYTHTCENGQEEIVFKELEEQPKKKKAPLEQNLPKSLDEVLRFFEKNAADKFPDWRDEAEAFFYHYESYGWNGTSSRKIVDWESKANLWICDKAMKYKLNQKQRSYEPTTINNTSNSRGASDEEVAELMERLLCEGELEREGLSHHVQP